MKRFFSLSVIFLISFTCWIPYLVEAQDKGGEVVDEAPDASTWMPDANLRTAVRNALGLANDDGLTQQKMLNLQGLNASKRGITSLTGLE